MLRADARVVQTGRDRVRLGDLALLVLEDVRAGAVQDARLARGQRGRVLAGLDSVSGGLEADQADAGVRDEGVEEADGVRAAADAGRDGVGQPAGALQDLAAGLDADDPVEVADHGREGVRTGDRAEEVVGAVHIGDPVAERLVDGVLEGPGAGLHGDDLGAQHPHPGHVQGLALGVDLAHVDGALEAEERAGGGGGDAVLAGSGLGDDAGLAHALGEQRLAQHVVDLVRAGVVEVLALEEDPGAPGVLGEPRHLGEGAGPAGVVDHQVVELGREGRVVLGLLVLDGDLVHGGDERLRDELAAEVAEVALGVGDVTLRVRNEERAAGHAQYSYGCDGMDAPYCAAGPPHAHPAAGVGMRTDAAARARSRRLWATGRERAPRGAVRGAPSWDGVRRTGPGRPSSQRVCGAPSHAVDLTGLGADHVPDPPPVHPPGRGTAAAGAAAARQGRVRRRHAGRAAARSGADGGAVVGHGTGQLRPWRRAGWAPAATRSATADFGSRPVTRDSPTRTASAPSLA